MKDNDKEFVDFPLIKKNKLEKRLYQETILNTAIKDNTLCVLPTGLGKTYLAILLAAYRMNKYGGKCMFLAPTRPLVEQHKKLFSDMLEIGDLKVLTGRVKPEQREKEYKKNLCFFSTPQTVKNDLLKQRLNLEDVTLLIFDEAHRGVKNYPYPFIAEKYMKGASNPRILALTASPGGSKERIDQVRKNLFIDNVEIRSEKDEDVKPYVQKIKRDWVKVELSEELEEIHSWLKEAFEKRLEKLKKLGFVQNKKIRKKDLIELQSKIWENLKEENPNPVNYHAVSLTAEALKIEHAEMLLETQGLHSLKQYLEKMEQESEEGKTRAVKRIMNDNLIKKAFKETNELLDKGVEHPKAKELYKILKQEFPSEGKKVIVFSHYRDTVNFILKLLKGIEGCRGKGFVGQAGERGLKQREQIELLKEFERGEFNTLVSTPVGEEGLDIPAVDLVVFYEPVPSEIRSIQRRGRTGRQKAGRIIILITKGTRDEGYYWKSKHKERRMKGILKDLKENKEQASLGEFGK